MSSRKTVYPNSDKSHIPKYYDIDNDEGNDGPIPPNGKYKGKKEPPKTRTVVTKENSDLSSWKNAQGERDPWSENARKESEKIETRHVHGAPEISVRSKYPVSSPAAIQTTTQPAKTTDKRVTSKPAKTGVDLK